MKKAMVLLAALLVSALLICAAGAEVVFAFESLEYTVSVRKFIDLKPILQGAELSKGAKYTWESEKPEVADVNNNGRVTAKAAGDVTITVTVKDTDDTSYTTSCMVHVIQPVTKIVCSEKEVKVASGYTKKLEMSVMPEDATNKQLRFTSSDPGICKVDDDGMLKGITANKSCQITVEAMDGSGVKTSVKVKVKTFLIPYDTIVLTERKTYELVLDSVSSFSDNYCFRYKRNGIFKVGNYGDGGNEWYYIGTENDYKNPDTGEKERKDILYIEPVKAGKQKLTFYDYDATWGVGGTKQSINIVVEPSAVYGSAAFPKLQYDQVTADPASFVGKTVYINGVITAIESTGSKSFRYIVATKGGTEQPVIAVMKEIFCSVANYNVGEKVEIYGVWQEPETTKTATGLTMTNPVVLIEKINDDIFNIDMRLQKAK